MLQRKGFGVLVVALLLTTAGLSQLPTYRVGRAPTSNEISEMDTYVGPSGEGLPVGRGSVKEGAEIFARKCAHCHGTTGEESKFKKLKMDLLHPFPTTIWSMINSSMPRSLPDVGVQAEKLPTNEVYALTAFVLHINGVIGEDAVVDEKSLAQIRMPTRDSRLDSLVPASGH